MRMTYVSPEGMRDECTWAIVGEQPGKTEVMSGRPFSGPAGTELTACISAAQLSRNDAYITNVIKDYDASINQYIEFTRSAPVVSDAGKKYLQELEEELLSLGPKCKCIVACGNVALWALTGRTGITKWRGSVLKSEIPGLNIPIVPIIHPATVLPPKCQYLNKHLIILDLRKVKKIIEGNYFPLERKIVITPTFEEVKSFLESIRSKSGQPDFRVAFDIEVYNEQVSCISFATSKTFSLCIPFVSHKGDYFSPEQETTIWSLIAEILEDERIQKLGQNVSFDAHFLLRRYGILTKNLDDTMIAQQILLGDYPKGLDFITSIWTDLPYYKDEGKKWFKLGGAWEQLWNYNALDSLACFEAFEKQLEQLSLKKNTSTYERQRLLIEPLIYMQERGILVDVDGMKNKAAELEAEALQLEEELNKLAGQPLNANSPKQLKDYFYIKKGFKPYVSKSGSLSVDKLALKRLARKGCDEARIILEIRKRRKLISTYLDITKVDSDSRMRCSYNPVGTRFSRLSSSTSIFGTGMNMQNVPHEILQYFLPDPGFVYYAFDLSQAENRIVAYVGNIPEMIDAFETGKDVHKLTAALIFKKPYDEVSDEPGSSPFNDGKSERDWGKRANHGLNYDLGYRSFALYYEMPESDAKFIVEAYHKAYPGVRQNYHAYVKQCLRENRTITNLMGRKTTFLDAWGDSLFKEAYSCIPQGTTGDIINERGLNYIYYNQRQFRPLELLVQVHDSIGFQIPLAVSWLEHARMLHQIKASLETPLQTHNGRTFSIPADLSMGLTMNKRTGKEIKHKHWPASIEELAKLLEENYQSLVAENN